MFLPHRLQLRFSTRLATALALLHLAALGGLLPLSIPLWLKLPLAAAIATSLGMSIRRHALLLAGSSLCELTLMADGTVEALRRDGGRFDARLSGRSAVLPGLAVILLELTGSRRCHPLVVLPDSLMPEDRRILLTWLRWEPT